MDYSSQYYKNVIFLHALHYSVDFIFLSFGIIGFIVWYFETIRGSLMTPKWQKVAGLAQEICTL